MVKSMTGYGRAQKDTGKKLITVEIRSVNHRFFDFSARVPRIYGFLEEALKGFISTSIRRGKVDMFVSAEDTGDEPALVQINRPLLAGYLNAFRTISKEYRLKNDISTSSLVQFKDIFTVARPEEDAESITKQVLEVAAEAAEQLVNMRAAEGRRLAEDIAARCSTVMSLISRVEERSPVTVEEYRDRLLLHMRQVLDTAGIEEQRILLEAALFADKVAVNEETVRLKSHISELLSMLSSEDAVGKKLDFMVQEMNREINTIGSKANDLAISHLVVEAKAEIESIREQVQNIE